ncbi:hypothetical protein B0H34DRAFT_701619 [Crassisporium funariophilum]|nr:hypothetical protein B0H34DRAFT_701619 [Crassisporium funariophilum]
MVTRTFFGHQDPHASFLIVFQHEGERIVENRPKFGYSLTGPAPENLSTKTILWNLPLLLCLRGSPTCSCERRSSMLRS